MAIGYISHALEQMRKRRISKTLVEEAVAKGQKRYIQRNGRIKCAYSKNNITIVIIYKKDRTDYTVITAYYPL